MKYNILECDHILKVSPKNEVDEVVKKKNTNTSEPGNLAKTLQKAIHKRFKSTHGESSNSDNSECDDDDDGWDD